MTMIIQSYALPLLPAHKTYLQIIDCHHNFAVRWAILKSHWKSERIEDFHIRVWIMLHIFYHFRIDNRSHQSFSRKRNLTGRYVCLSVIVGSFVDATHRVCAVVVEDSADLHSSHCDSNTDVYVHVGNRQLSTIGDKYLWTWQVLTHNVSLPILSACVCACDVWGTGTETKIPYSTLLFLSLSYLSSLDLNLHLDLHLHLHLVSSNQQQWKRMKWLKVMIT